MKRKSHTVDVVQWELEEDEFDDHLQQLVATWYDDHMLPSSVNGKIRKVLQEAKARDVHVDVVEAIVSEVQRVAGKSVNDGYVLSILDPVGLDTAGRRVVNALNVYKAQADAFILSHLHQPVKASQLIQFGLQLRCFLDLAIRFTNVPMRVQCTKCLHAPHSANDQFVSKLVRHGHSYYRVIHLDKTTASHVPVKIPVGTNINAYLWFYLQYCRKCPSSDFVFQSEKGRVWHTVSRDLKQFCSDIGLSDLARDRRFIHRSRNIGIAMYALACGMDYEKIRRFVVLLRTGMDTVDKFYAPWLKMHASQRASEEMFQLHGETIPQPKPQPLPNIHAPPELLVFRYTHAVSD